MAQSLKTKTILLILDNIRSAFNVGSIFRTCDGAGVARLYLTGITAYPPHAKIPKTALGAEDFVDWEYHKNPIEVVKCLKEGRVGKLRRNALHKSKVKSDISDEAFEIISFELTKNSISFFEYKFPNRSALIFGHELGGVNEELIKLSDQIVHIPMHGKKESLNVATSVGVGLYEAMRD